MRRLLALGISIGLLAGVFTWVAGSIPPVAGVGLLVVWVGFAAWALFYAAGGTTGGLGRTVASTLSGAVWGFLIVTALNGSASALVLGLLVAVAAFGMCVQAAFKPLAFIPGAFVGAAAFFGNSATGTFWTTVLSLVVGALLAFASERFADVIERALGERPQHAPAETGQLG